MKELLEKITPEMVHGMRSGDSIPLNDEYELYRYESEDTVVVMDSENYDEVFEIHRNDNGSITIEEL